MLLLLYNCRRFFFILSFFVGYILTFGLVRLRTIWLSACAGAHIECSSRLHAENVTIIDVIIKIPDRKWDWGVNDVKPRSDGLGILVIFEKSSELRSVAGRGQSSWSLRDVSHVCWVRWNGQHSKNCVSLSSCRKTKLKKSINVSYLN